MAYEVIKSEMRYKGYIVDVVNDKITLPDGKTAHREVIVRGSATAIVPVDENGIVSMVRQYRHGTREMLLEVPAGMIDPGEDPQTCAIRELEEETGLIAGKIVKLTDLSITPGYCNERITLYLATDLTPGKQNFDEDEFLELEKYPLDTLVEMVMSGEITDAKTICGILMAQQYIKA